MTVLTSSPPRSAAPGAERALHRRSVARRGPRGSAATAPSPAAADAFVDAAPRRVRPPRAWPRPSSATVLAIVAAGGALATFAVGHPLPLVGTTAAAVVAGAWLPGRALERWLVPAAIVAGGAAAVAATTSGASPLTASLHGLVAGCVVTGFGLLPRALVHGAVHAARRAERARADAEVLRLVDDARLFRRVGRDDAFDDVPGDDRSTRKDVACAVAQRDRLYRLLRLVQRVVPDTAVVALYALDNAGKHLDLVEQVACTDQDGAADAQSARRLTLAGRGTGAAGVVGLALQRRCPLRVVDEGGGAVRAHRSSGPAPASVLAVPLLAPGGAARGVLVVDRTTPTPFLDDDEAVLRACADEVVDGLHTEQLVDDLEAARRRVARVYAATRALTGVSRTGDVVEQALRSVGELCPGVALVQLAPNAAGSHDGATARVLGARGPLAPLQGFSAALDGEAFAARAVAERAPLPHTALDKASPRPLIAGAEPLARAAVGDLRAVPLLAHGEAHGVLVVASTPGERLRGDVVDAVVAIADVLALALVSAAAFDDVERQATTDGLTGVWNRRTLDRRLDEAVARVRRNGQPLCVVLADVDHFKSVNDTWGHATGDEVLKGVARTLQDCARTTDVVGRLGGEEFVVVCEGTDLAGALVVAERMRAALKALRFDTSKGPLAVTSSFGVAVWTDGETGHAALERADQHLYRAKQQGRDRVVGA
ncbi:MAG: GGDEF domain-containing protein [Deltaproteobacteria bacterium]|nr:GGDEF domain-containing protein [Deltaproteobacteria bacterium]